jgi:TPR repeat protein
MLGARLVGLIGALALAGTACGPSRERVLAEEKCARGIADACLTAASLERDPKKADRYYRRACRGVGGAGTLEGCLKAIGDDPAAVCRAEGAFLCSTVVDIYVREKKTDQAQELLTRLCEAGDESSCGRRDAAYWNQCRGGDPAGCAVLKAACTQGSTKTCQSLFHYYHLRCIAAQTSDCPEARDAAQTGCTAGDEKSCQSLGTLLQGECTTGSAASCAEHRNFTVEACSRGYSWACGTLEDSDRLGCKRLDAGACSRLDNACRMGASSNCESLDEILFAVCEREPAVCRILEERCQALNAPNLCSAAISGYATGCREGKGKREACDGLVDMCHRGNKDACDVAKLKVLTSFGR